MKYAAITMETDINSAGIYRETTKGLPYFVVKVLSAQREITLRRQFMRWLVSFYNPNWHIDHDTVVDSSGEVVLGASDKALSHNEWTISIEDVLDVPSTVWRDSVRAGHIPLEFVPDDVIVAEDDEPEYIYDN